MNISIVSLITCFILYLWLDFSILIPKLWFHLCFNFRTWIFASQYI